MSKKQPLPVPKTKVYITGYYVDKNGKKRYGFVKRDARKKQTVWIKNLDTMAKYRLPALNKKELKEFRKNVGKYLVKEYKKFKGKKIEKVESEIEEVRVSPSEPFDRRVDQGEFKRVEGMGTSKTLEGFRNYFFSSFSQGAELKAKFVVVSVYLQVTFKHRRQYSYTSNFFIFSKRYYIDLSLSEIAKQFQEILKKINDRVRKLKTDYEILTKDIKIINKNEWLIEKEDL